MKYGSLNYVLSEDSELQSFGKSVRKVVSIPISALGALGGGVLLGVAGAATGAGVGALTGGSIGYGSGYSIPIKGVNRVTGALGGLVGAIPGAVVGSVAGAGLGAGTGMMLGGLGTYATINQDSVVSDIISSKMKDNKRNQFKKKFNKFI